MKIIMFTMLLVSGIVLADHVQPANPDRTRVAGSALILKSDKVIDEPSIPSNAISKSEAVAPANKVAPTNKIVEGTAHIIEVPSK
jgi:hypothetical protein